MLDMTTTCTLYHLNPTLAEPINLLLRRKQIEVTHKYIAPKNIEIKENTPAFSHCNFVLFGTEVLLNYIEEIFPDPSLLPANPTERAVHRMLINQILTDWYGQTDFDIITKINGCLDALNRTRYFLSNDINAIDCFLYPLMKNIGQLPGPHPRVRQYYKDLKTFFDTPTPKEEFEGLLSYSLL